MCLKYRQLVLSFGLIIQSFFSFSQTIFQGKVVDASNNEIIVGAQVYFPDLKLIRYTDTLGYFSFHNLPSTSSTFQITADGYRNYVEKLNLIDDSLRIFRLAKNVTEKELNEVVITASSHSGLKNKMPYSMSTLSLEELQQSTSSNIIDALTQDPAISQIGTGPGISKPVIRGLGMNRVVVLHDGFRQEGQQWGDEHGVEIDEYSVYRVEVEKGVAGLAHGSDAMGGVINMMTAPAVSDGTIQGNVLLNYQTNNGMIGGSANIEGNHQGLIWNARYSRKMAHSYKNANDGYVFNSGFTENALNGMIGLTRRWGYSHLHVSAYDMTLGIVEGERDSLTGQFLKEVAMNDSTVEEEIANRADFLSYSVTKNVPYQKIRHYKASLLNRFFISKGMLDVTLGWQQNQRKEFDEILEILNYGMFLDAHSFHLNSNYRLPEINHWVMNFGVNSQYQISSNRGEEFLIPDFQAFKSGGFFFFSREWKKWNFLGGVRYDFVHQQAKELWDDGEIKFENFSKNYHGLAASLGATYSITENLYTKLNISKGFRTPNISELSSNGIHEGTVNYIIGSHSLKPENSIQTDYSIGWSSEHVNAEIDVFHNYIQNFIYLQKVMDANGNDLLTEGYQTFQYQSGNAHLVGGELSIDFHPHPWDWLHVKNTFGYVMGMQTNVADSLRFLPFIPAPKWNIEIIATKKQMGKYFGNAFIRLAVHQSFEKRYVHTAYHTETPTPYYALLSVGIGTDIVGKKKKPIMTISIQAENLLNQAYQSHLSRLKYLDRNNVTGNQGVFNMGRNFSFKVGIPIRIKKDE